MLQRPLGPDAVEARVLEGQLERVEARADTSVISSLAFAARQFALQELAKAAAEAGDVAPEEAERWLFDLTERDDTGRFEASVTYVTARGFAPG